MEILPGNPVLRFVHNACHFLNALTPLQPRYWKKADLENSQLAVLIAQAMNHGNLSMAEIANISYQDLKDVHASCFRLATLKEANDMISRYNSCYRGHASPA